LIILDYNQTFISAAVAHSRITGATGTDESLLRHMALNTIRAVNVRFRGSDGRLVIAADHNKSWRSGVFPYYKANRKSRSAYKDGLGIDWTVLFSVMDEVREGLEQYFAYPVIRVEGAEADDVIATLVEAIDGTESVMIVSGDHDFYQLQAFPRVSQYDWVHKKSVAYDVDPFTYLHDHVIRGDPGDGVPNVFSEDDVFVNPSAKKTRVTPRKLALVSPALSSTDPTIESRLRRNETLIDLNFTPARIKDSILSCLAAQANKDGAEAYRYLTRHNLRRLYESLSDF